MQMEESWRRRGYVPDSDSDEEDEFDSLNATRNGSDKDPELGSLEYIDLPSEGPTNQPKGSEGQIDKGDVALSDPASKTQTPRKSNFEVRITVKSAHKGSAQKRQSLGETPNGSPRSTTTTPGNATPTRQRGRANGAWSSATRRKTHERTDLSNSNTNTPAQTGSIYDIPSSSPEKARRQSKPSSKISTPRASYQNVPSASKRTSRRSTDLATASADAQAQAGSIFDIPSSSPEKQTPRSKISSKNSTPRAPNSQQKPQAQQIAEPQTPKTRGRNEGSPGTRSPSPGVETGIPLTTRENSFANNPIEETDEPSLPPPLPLQSNLSDDSPLSSAPSFSESLFSYEVETAEAGENNRKEPNLPTEGTSVSREATREDANQDDILSGIGIPEEALRELQQGTQRTFRKRTTIQMQPYAFDLVQWQEHQRRMGLPIHRRVGRIADEAQEQENYDPGVRSSSPPAEEYLPPTRPDRVRPERDHDEHEVAPWHARIVKRQKTSHATPKVSRSLHKGVKPRGIRDGPSAAGDQNANSVFDLTSSPPHTGRLSSASRTPRASDGEFRFPRGWSPPPGMSLPEVANAEDDVDSTDRADSGDEGVQSISSDSQQSDGEHNDELDSEDEEARAMRRLQRQIRGVLPASHMRIEQKRAADRQKILQREKERQDALHRPDGKGVARKLVRKGGRSTQPATQLSRSLFDLGDSDDDDEDSTTDTNNTHTNNTPFKNNDQRSYETNAQGSVAADGDILEDNRIDYMFAPVARKTAGPRGPRKAKSLKRPNPKPSTSARERQPKRRRQTRMTDASYGSRRTKESSTIRRPRIGILDAPDVARKPRAEQPPFLKVALRKAQSRRDGGRRSPTQKFFQLASREDTADVNESLRDWKRGSIPQQKVSRRPPQTRKQPSKILSMFRSQALRPPQASLAPRPKQAPRAPRTQPRTRTPRISNQASQRPVDHFMSHTPRAGPEEAPGDSVAAPVPATAVTAASTASNPVPTPTPRARPSGRQFEKRGHVWILQNNSGIVPPARAQPRPAGASAARPIGDSLSVQPRLSHYLNTAHGHGGQSGGPSFTLRRYLSDANSMAPGTHGPSTNSIGANPPQPKSQATNQVPHQPRRRIRKHRPTRIEPRTDRESAPMISDDAETPVITHVGKPRPASSTTSGLFNFPSVYPIEFGMTTLLENTYFHGSTFIGSGEFSRSLNFSSRNLDGQASPLSINVQDKMFNWGSWSDAVSSEMGHVFDVIMDHVERAATTSPEAGIAPELGVASHLYRLLIKYVTESLVFIDPVDRTGFVTRTTVLVSQARDPLAVFLGSEEYNRKGLVKIACFNMVLSEQIRQVASHRLVSPVLATEASDLVKSSAKDVAVQLATKSSSSELKALSEENSETDRRELGAHGEYPSAEAYVVAKHLLRNSDHYQGCFEEIQLEVCEGIVLQNERDVGNLESAWRGIFTVMPLNEVDPQGKAHPGFRFTAINDNWKVARRLLAPVLDHFETNSAGKPISFHKYCQALFHRCHGLINTWGWRECKPILESMFDFFAKHNLRNLKLEEDRGSPSFLDELDKNPSLDVRPGEPCFHTFLKIVASGLRFLSKRYNKKKIQNITWRLLPNHGRVYPKDQELQLEDLAALRNHHDLLIALYWAVPDGSRPRVEALRNLVHPAISHRGACSISIRSWSRLVRFKLSTDEEISGLAVFGEWYGFFVTELHQQHFYARKEIESRDKGVHRFSLQEIEELMSDNQRHLEHLMNSALSALQAAVKLAPTLEHAHQLVAKVPYRSLFSLFNPKNPRVNHVVVEALQGLVSYTQKDISPSKTQTSAPVGVDEDSQEFGDWDAIEAVYDQQSLPSEGITHAADVIHPVVSRLLSNCFGEDHCPEDTILLSVLECWTSLASVLVRHRLRGWDSYLSHHGNDSWLQLRRTVQTRKFEALFLASCIEKDAQVLPDCWVEVMSLWMSSLVERSSMLKFQHRLTEAILNQANNDPLFSNLPFMKDNNADRYTITLGELSSRRLSLLSSLLSNMRETLQEKELSASRDFSTTKQDYSEVVQRMMTAMKHNYQELGDGTAQAAQGAYVGFVHCVIGFLQQHASEIRPIDPFFTDPASFPLPVQDPRYIIAKLKRYEPKLGFSKEIMILVGFMQSISERAAIDVQQTYLVDQLHASMNDTYESGIPNKPTLRAVLLQCVFPAYLESAFESPTSWILAHPIIQTVTLEFKTLRKNMDTFDSACVLSVINMIDAVCQASCQALNSISSHRDRLQSPATLSMISAFVEMVSSVLSTVDYIEEVTDKGEELLVHIKWMNSFIKAVAECVQMTTLDTDRAANMDDIMFPELPSLSNNRKTDLFSTAHRLASNDLQTYLRKWTYHQEKYYFTRPGHPAQEVKIQPEIATAMTDYIEAQQAFEDAAKSFTYRAESLELL
ncbi:uncharacterized protein N7506_011588 [Penicillium brevicompactum]|uniref:uncharacterized protein n=1 Tax=Penicillium brevicompactum TaxID=5074 RepID=UPI00254162C1|nr:uncharacterized protein N7506_011588 [Penicillium brevicompactum]KAJ5318884.1 hypothetical protein N7506_011588 [Penicillium brevicompactum]